MQEANLNMESGSKQPAPTSIPRLRQVHTITDRFSIANTYLIDDGQFIVVDPGSALNVHLLKEYLQQFLHRSPDGIDLVVLTHLHPDHTTGVDTLRKISQAPVAASITARQLVQTARNNQHFDGHLLPPVTHVVGQVFSHTALPGALHHLDLFPPHYERQIQMVDLWLEDVTGLPNHPNWRVIASPGHTPESLCLYNPFTHELLCGDTVVTLERGAALVRTGTNRHQLEQTLQTLRSLEVYYLYPGHGRPILSKHALHNIEVEW
jgi:glyoxylase-like metal-dependent hydrolase (beta-lactamase superfamily II)